MSGDPGLARTCGAEVRAGSCMTAYLRPMQLA